MPFGEAVVSPSADYAAMFHTDPTGTNETARIEIKMFAGDENWTLPGLDEVFQALLDQIEGSPLFAFSNASKSQRVSTVVSPTLPPEVDESP